jgi:hypothetical protein
MKNTIIISVEEAKAIFDYPYKSASPQYKYVCKGIEEYDGEYASNGYLVFSFEDKNYIVYYIRDVNDVYFYENKGFITAEEAEEYTITLTEWRAKA